MCDLGGGGREGEAWLYISILYFLSIKVDLTVA